MTDEHVEAEAAPPQVEHINTFHTEETFPAPTGFVPNVIAATPTDVQSNQTEQFYTFINNPDSDLLTLNADTVPRTALLCLPGSSNVKVVYCPGRGSSQIGRASPLENKTLFLTGDAGRDKGDPTPVVLSDDDLFKISVISFKSRTINR